MSEDERDLDLDSEDEGTGAGFSSLAHGQDKRAHHNALERKRRDHIKDSFTGLKDAIPSLQARQGDKCSRAQILKKASEYIAFMRRKNSSHSSDIEDLKRQNQHLENQIRSMEKAKSVGQFVSSSGMFVGDPASDQQLSTDRDNSPHDRSPSPGQSLLGE